MKSIKQNLCRSRGSRVQWLEKVHGDNWRLTLHSLKNMKLLAKIASRFNLIGLIFQNFPVGACPQAPLEGVCFAQMLCTQQ